MIWLPISIWMEWFRSKRNQIYYHICENVFFWHFHHTIITSSKPKHQEQDKALMLVSSHYNDATWSISCLKLMESVCSTACFDGQHRKHSSSTSLSLCEGNPQVDGGLALQRASNVESISMSWCLHDFILVGHIISILYHAQVLIK